MFPEKNIALLKIQTQTGQTFVTVQTFMPLDKRINARPFRDPQLLHSPIFLSPSLPVSLFSPRARKSQRRPWVHASKRTRARARTTLFPPSPLPPFSFWITIEHRAVEIYRILFLTIPLLRYLFLLPLPPLAILHLLGGVLWNPLNRPL